MHMDLLKRMNDCYFITDTNLFLFTSYIPMKLPMFFNDFLI